MCLGEPQQFGMLTAARRAPCGEEVEHDPASSAGREIERLPSTVVASIGGAA